MYELLNQNLVFFYCNASTRGGNSCQKVGKICPLSWPLKFANLHPIANVTTVVISIFYLVKLFDKCLGRDPNIALQACIVFQASSIDFTHA